MPITVAPGSVQRQQQIWREAYAEAKAAGKSEMQAVSAAAWAVAAASKLEAR